ncbi:hypothetical protein M3Y99_01919000 [Aphelenchoides fujianensis]|nr:hypothetical protein M3Y99_01919000 [Aphelenchoides fujianensis]
MVDNQQPTCSAPAPPPLPLQYDRLPHFLIQQIGESLSIDDRLSFMTTSPHVFRALKPSFRRFTYIQICDEHRENFLKEGKTGEEFAFSGRHLVQLLQLCTNLETVMIAVVKATSLPLLVAAADQTSCPLFETSMYNPGGYIGRFCQLAPPSLLQSLKNLSLNVDLTVQHFAQLLLPMPGEDLVYSVANLANCSFNTFVQIGFCASAYSPDDAAVNRQFLSDMNRACAHMRAIGCKSQLDVGANGDGFVDLTVEVGNLEYSLAYFYFNESICVPVDERDDEMDDQEDAFLEFNEILFDVENTAAPSFPPGKHLLLPSLESQKPVSP